MRTALLTLILAAVPVAALAQDAEFPDGWQARLDRADANASDVRFSKMGDGYHVTMGPSAILYDPAQRAEGSYTASATFTQTRASSHPEGYGLIIGGRDLDGATQDYVYFLVRQDGRFTIRHRGGSEVHTIAEWTEHPAVARVGDGGSATNALSVEAGPQRARFLVNGQEVASYSDVSYLNTEGIVGLRVNHNLDLHIAGFGIDG